ncbi:MAG: spore cortex-lytic enzyme [Clostridia bacterium]|nr:spore cortex-lytic enzyme [Clostridia bacterium]
MKKKIVAIFFVFLTLFTVTTATFIFANNGTEIVAEAAVLKTGSSGTQVKTLQTKLKSWGYYFSSVDGIFGSKTKTAVIYFQRVNGLTQDGIVGAKTAASLGMSLSSTSTSSSSSGYSSADVYLLAKLVYAEARGEPYTGQVAVAAVVLNRVKSSLFPNTISGVIYEPYAFTCVSDGQINYAPNDTAKKAAQDAMNGWDPSNGCIYYYNPATATSTWMKKRPVLLVIGNHAFTL